MRSASEFALADTFEMDEENLPTSLNAALDQLVDELQNVEDLAGVTDGVAAVAVALQVLGHGDMARVYRALSLVTCALDVYGIAATDG